MVLGVRKPQDLDQRVQTGLHRIQVCGFMEQAHGRGFEKHQVPDF